MKNKTPSDVTLLKVKAQIDYRRLYTKSPTGKYNFVRFPFVYSRSFVVANNVIYCYAITANESVDLQLPFLLF